MMCWRSTRCRAGARWPRSAASMSRPRSSATWRPMTSEHARNLHDWTALACIWEATARKAGNVNPQRSFRDLAYSEFVVSAVAIAPVFAAGQRDGVGNLVLRAIQATRRLVRSNTNLGIVLLLAPMAVASADGTLRETLPAVLDRLTVEDSRLVYEAIRLAA